MTLMVTTIRINKGHNTYEKLNVLAGAISKLKENATTDYTNQKCNTYKKITESKYFKHLKTKNNMTEIDKTKTPRYTPYKYEAVGTREISIDNERGSYTILEIIIPTMSDNQDDLNYYHLIALHDVIHQLFGKTIHDIKVKQGSSKLSFNTLKPKHVNLAYGA